MHPALNLPEGWGQQAFVNAAASRGVILRTGDMFYVDSSLPRRQIRVVLGSPETRGELAKALMILEELLNGSPSQ